jgi:DNA-binding beta-propeller fold protein YncE
VPGVTTPKPSRRQLLQAGAGTLLLAGAVRPASAAADAIATDARPDVVHRGRAVAVTPTGSHVVVAHGARATLTITNRRTRKVRTVTLAGHPLELAISPDGALIAVTTAFWDHPGVELIRVADGVREGRLDAGGAPFAPAFTHDRKHLLVTGGEDGGTLRILRGPDFARGRTIALGRVPRGIAVAPDGRGAWIALHAEDAVVRVNLRTATITHRIAVPVLPDRLALSPSGRTLLISHGGHFSHLVSELDTRSGELRPREAGGAASAVAWGAGGRRLIALQREDAVAVIDARGKRRLLPTVAGPRGLAIAGRHAFTVSSLTGAVGRVRA